MTPADSEQVDVLVIGAGPAGLAAATRLRELGIGKVVVVERESKAGGMPRHCGHSPFGMREFRRVLTGPAYAKRLAKAARENGVDLRVRHSVVSIEREGRATVATPDGIISFEASRIVLATGAREASRAGRLIGGDRTAGVMNTAALQSYVYLHGIKPFRRPVIIGSELVSMSAIATCVTSGIRPMALVESRSGPLVRYPFALFPPLVGMSMHYSSEIESINGRERVESVTLRGQDGKTIEIDCDGVVVSGRFRPEATLAAMAGLDIDPGSQGPSIDQFGRSSDPHIFVAGNLLRAVETAGRCWAEGRKIADVVALDLAHPALAHRTVSLRLKAPNLKYVVPQRITLGDEADVLLQLRVRDDVTGDIRLEQDGAVLTAARLRTAPERRISLTLPACSIADTRGDIDCVLEDNNAGSSRTRGTAP